MCKSTNALRRREYSHRLKPFGRVIYTPYTRQSIYTPHGPRPASPTMSAASLSPPSSRSSSLSSAQSARGPRTPPNMHQNTIDPAAKWLVQKYGGTSVGKFAAQIAQNIIPYVIQLLQRPAQPSAKELWSHGYQSGSCCTVGFLLASTMTGRAQSSLHDPTVCNSAKPWVTGR